MSKRNAIKYIQNEEPSFIRQFKEKVGYKEGPDVNTKRQKLEYEDGEEEDRSDTEEEKPTVVVLKLGDLTAEEAGEEENFKKYLEEEQAIQEGKITFKKPVKKNDSEGTPPAGDTAADATSDSPKPAKDKGKSKGKKKKDKEQKKSQSLLSFGDEEEEEEG